MAKPDRGALETQIAADVRALTAESDEIGRYFYEYTTLAKSARLGARYLVSKSITSATTDWKSNAKKIVVYGNTSGTGTPILTGLSVDNVDVQYVGGTTGIPDMVKVSIINYPHTSVFDLGKLTSMSLNVDVKPSVTMRYLLTTPSI